MTGTGADWPGRVLRRPPVPAADRPPSSSRPPAGTAPATTPTATGRLVVASRLATGHPVDAPTLRLDPAAVARTRGENR
ncbi:hypothetical protein [Micromonospora inyonensis]|uniref:hypothetical protein n=1 Tax=Micromonospora inyonensis TaxID=47866 RepID=UPI00114CEBFC|nr:hypothetical protein [Micromonospora inyonensis]